MYHVFVDLSRFWAAFPRKTTSSVASRHLPREGKAFISKAAVGGPLFLASPHGEAGECSETDEVVFAPLFLRKIFVKNDGMGFGGLRFFHLIYIIVR